MYRKTQLDLNKEEDQLFFRNVMEKYKYNDTFRCSVPIKMKNHYHKDDEVRYFLSGEAKFFVGEETIECKPGTLIEIGKGVVHSFEYNGVGGKLEVRRCFENEAEYQEYYIQD